MCLLFDKIVSRGKRFEDLSSNKPLLPMLVRTRFMLKKTISLQLHTLYQLIPLSNWTNNLRKAIQAIVCLSIRLLFYLVLTLLLIDYRVLYCRIILVYLSTPVKLLNDVIWHFIPFKFFNYRN